MIDFKKLGILTQKVSNESISKAPSLMRLIYINDLSDNIFLCLWNIGASVLYKALHAFSHTADASLP